MDGMKKYEILFGTSGSAMDAGWMGGVLLQRAKTVKAGQMLYCDSYPIWSTEARRTVDRALESKKGQSGTREVQKLLNARNAQRKLEQIINANFGPGDLLVTCTYRDGDQPETAEQAHKDAKNMIQRVRRLRRRKGLPEVKYVYVTEYTQSEKRGTRYHHHMILSGDGVTREEIEALWIKKHGGICNTRRAQYQKEGLTGWAKYITKQVSGRKSGQQVATCRRWSRSQNLVVPRATVADKKISLRRVREIARDVEDSGKAIFEKLYPGYELLECRVRTSEFVPGAYISVLMTRRNGKPKERGRYHEREEAIGA